jgi:outer membrane protein assembly factor BamE (lipoprotein component of BamABCDE complex)
MTKRRILFSGALAVALGASAVAGAQTSLSTPSFDSAIWKAQKGKHVGSGNTRSKMTDEAVSLLKPGMTRAEVEALLGAPDEMNRQFLYGTDPKKARTITFDRNGKVVPQSPDLTAGVSGAGMTPKQVKAVIGEPNVVQDDYTYYLGTPGMAPDPEYLHVLFDADGKLVRHFKQSG